MHCHEKHEVVSTRHRYRSLELRPETHGPEEIMCKVKELTQHPDDIQMYYQREFVRIYKKWLRKETPIYDGRPNTLSEDLQSAMEALDGFFFAGSLTRPAPYGMYGYPIANLEAQDNIFCEGEPGHQAYLGIGRPVLSGAASAEGGGWTTIYIDTLENGCPRTIKSILETLVHEMAHAIYIAFACDGTECQQVASRPHAIGRRGHGRLWVQMAELMRTAIRGWDDDLADFYDTNEIRLHNREFN